MATRLVGSISWVFFLWVFTGLGCSGPDDSSGDGGDGDGDADADADADGDVEPDGPDAEADGDASPGFVLDAPADGEHFHVLQPVLFTGYTPGPLEVVVDGTWSIGTAGGPGPFEIEHPFSDEGTRRVAFLVDGVEVHAIDLVIEPGLARVCLSPGHPSSEGDKLYEAIINRKVAFYLEEMLVASGYEVLIVVDDITREEIFADGFDNEGAEEQAMLEVVTLSERAAACNEWPADYFISLHHNAVDDPSPNYTLVLYGESSAGSPRFPDAVDWAELTRDFLYEAMDVTDGYARGDRSFLGFGLSVLQNTDMVGILTEGSFYSNPEERARLNDDEYLLGEAEAIYSGFVAFVEG